MANYPSSDPTIASLHTAVNNLSTALDGAIDGSQVTITVLDTTNFPAVGAVTIEAERISYTGKTATTFTGLTRGFGGTNNVPHVHMQAYVRRTDVEVIAIAADLRDTFKQDLDDAVSPAATAADLKIRLDHIATQLKLISGEADWKTSPAKALNALLALSGGTMAGNIAMATNKVTGLAQATIGGDAVRFDERGRIVQVVLGNNTTTPFSTTLSTYQLTNSQVTITPKFSTSTILILASSTMFTANSAATIAYATITRDGTNIVGADGLTRVSVAGATNIDCPTSFMAIDSPASTSALNYRVSIKVGGAANTISWGVGANTQVIIAAEILA